MSGSPSSLLSLVLRLTEWGWRLLPCAVRGKKPLVSDWPQRASSDVEVISAWAGQHEGCNWGVACGPGSGLWVLDVDGEEGNQSLLSLLQSNESDWTETLTVTTARGRHYYYRYPETIGVRTSTGLLGRGLDVRGAGGYVIVPPSVHPTGVSYEWAGQRQSVERAPIWLLALVASGSGRKATIRVEIGALFKGSRNDGLTRLAGAMRRKGATAAEIEIALLEHNGRRCRPPLLDSEVRKIAASVSRYAPGGPDPLEQAWAATEGQSYGSSYERFLAIVRELQHARPGQPIALPLERIAALLRCDWTLVRRHRKRAVLAGLIHRVADYVPHRRAAQYRVTVPLGIEGTCPTRTAIPLVSPTSDLVGHPHCNTPS